MFHCYTKHYMANILEKRSHIKSKFFKDNILKLPWQINSDFFTKKCLQFDGIQKVLFNKLKH